MGRTGWALSLDPTGSDPFRPSSVSYWDAVPPPAPAPGGRGTYAGWIARREGRAIGRIAVTWWSAAPGVHSETCPSRLHGPERGTQDAKVAAS
jgi:hypothetical protein